MNFLPQELLVRVCSFLCTTSLCRFCGASKALRIALKDELMAWENALQSTWWYPIDTLKRHDNFTFWCSRYAIRRALPPGREDQNIVAQYAVVSFEDGEIIGRCKLLHDELRACVNDHYEVIWDFVGSFDCGDTLSLPRSFPLKGECAFRKVILDIYSTFGDFTMKYTSNFDVHSIHRPGTMKCYLGDFYCPFAFMTMLCFYRQEKTEGLGKLYVRQTYREDVEHLYDSYLNQTGGHEAEAHYHDGVLENIADMRTQFMVAEAESTRGYGIERKCIRDSILSLCSSENRKALFSETDEIRNPKKVKKNANEK